MPSPDLSVYSLPLLDFQTYCLTALFTPTRAAVVFKRLEFLPGFYKGWNTWLCGFGGKMVWKTHLCGKQWGCNTWVVWHKESVCLLLLCTVGQGWDALLSPVLVWDCYCKAPVSYKDLKAKSKTSWCATAFYTRTHAHTHAIVTTYYCRRSFKKQRIHHLQNRESVSSPSFPNPPLSDEL